MKKEGIQKSSVLFAVFFVILLITSVAMVSAESGNNENIFSKIINFVKGIFGVQPVVTGAAGACDPNVDPNCQCNFCNPAYDPSCTDPCCDSTCDSNVNPYCVPCEGSGPYCRITVTKYNDKNGDGVRQESTEEGFAGVFIKLLKDSTGMGDFGEVANDLTDWEGKVVFEVDNTGDPWFVADEDLSQSPGYEDWTMTSEPRPFYCDGWDNIATGATSIGNKKGETNCTIKGIKFNDEDGNGVKSAGEVGVSGVYIYVHDSGTKLGETNTDSNGEYSFSVEAPESSGSIYSVCEKVPGGMESTTPDNGTAAEGDNCYLDDIPCVAGETYTRDFGNKEKVECTITGYKFNDSDGNGVQNGAENGLQGIKIILKDPYNEIASTTTFSEGYFSFKVPALDGNGYLKQYALGEELSQSPGYEGWELTTTLDPFYCEESEYGASGVYTYHQNIGNKPLESDRCGNGLLDFGELCDDSALGNECCNDQCNAYLTRCISPNPCEDQGQGYYCAGTVARCVNVDESSSYEAKQICEDFACVVPSSSIAKYSSGEWKFDTQWQEPYCCGDDLNEFFTQTTIDGTTYEACCYPESDCVDTNGDCQDGTGESVANGNCEDGLDNDCDGLEDYYDPDGLCVEVCDDGKNNDGDEDIDCADSDCWGKPGPDGYNCCGTELSYCTGDEHYDNECNTPTCSNNVCSYPEDAAGTFDDDCETCQVCGDGDNYGECVAAEVNKSGSGCTGVCEACDGTYGEGSCNAIQGELKSDDTRCDACTRCDGTTRDACVNIANGEQDKDGNNLCEDECAECSGGACVAKQSNDNALTNICNRCDGDNKLQQKMDKVEDSYDRDGLNGGDCKDVCWECSVGVCIGLNDYAEDTVGTKCDRACEGCFTLPGNLGPTCEFMGNLEEDTVGGNTCEDVCWGCELDQNGDPNCGFVPENTDDSLGVNLCGVMGADNGLKEECYQCDGKGGCDQIIDKKDSFGAVTCDDECRVCKDNGAGEAICDFVDENTDPFDECDDTLAVFGCFLYPDGNPFTLDYQPGVNNTCDGAGACEDLDAPASIHTCSDNDPNDGSGTGGLPCGAECDQNLDCAGLVEGCYGSEYRIYTGTCDLANTCTCEYTLLTGLDDSNCNGIDDDCDGYVDEDYVVTPTSCGIGACQAEGTLQCINGTEINSCIAGTGALDDSICNLIDDDCDGLTDEDYVSISTTCGVGACASTGTTSCVNGAEEDSCTKGTPALNDTTCNGIDDNCNGFTDEGYVSISTTCGVGACESTGIISCVNGAEQDSCVIGTPAANDANCNGIDDNCDGEVDEDYVATSTSCGIGACQASGTLECVDGVKVDSCTSGTGSLQDILCNGIDDDCDGEVDEDYILTQTSCGVGACESTGTTSCVNGAEQDSCLVGTPSLDDSSCDGIDNNCNGLIDEDYLSIFTTCGAGSCSSEGATSCMNGVEYDSCVIGTPALNDATCDGLDNDCDGSIDEDYISQLTTCGVGSCSSEGATSCMNGTEYDSCVVGTPAANDATCDGLDNDCDGLIDEGYLSIFTTCGLGVCGSIGETSCVNGVEQDSCTSGSATGDDSNCDGLDDNCDGTSDNNYIQMYSTCGVGACESTGIKSCVEGTEYDSCTPGIPGIEVCNNVDDDCDGFTDEGDVCSGDDDDDDDGVPNWLDKCEGTDLWYASEGLKPNHYDSSNLDLTLTYGCSINQILFCKPGNNNGEEKWGITVGTLDVWTSQTGWASDCQVNGVVALEGESKPFFEDTDNSGMPDIFDSDNDNDGIPDVEDSEDDSVPVESGKEGTGKPDWWCDKHPNKC